MSLAACSVAPAGVAGQAQAPVPPGSVPPPPPPPSTAQGRVVEGVVTRGGLPLADADVYVYDLVTQQVVMPEDGPAPITDVNGRYTLRLGPTPPGAVLVVVAETETELLATVLDDEGALVATSGPPRAYRLAQGSGAQTANLDETTNVLTVAFADAFKALASAGRVRSRTYNQLRDNLKNLIATEQAAVAREFAGNPETVRALQASLEEFPHPSWNNPRRRHGRRSSRRGKVGFDRDAALQALKRYVELKAAATKARQELEAAAGTQASPSAAPQQSLPSTVEFTTLSGVVYDENGARLDGVRLEARSLTEAVAYEGSVTTSGGSYVFNKVPSGVTITLTATKDGYTARQRVVVPVSNKQGDPAANRYDFGYAAGSTTDPNGGAARFLSDHPEIVSVTPADEARGLTSSRLTYTVTLSEPLDETNRQRFVDAFHIVPSNAVAVGSPSGAVIDVEAGEDTEANDLQGQVSDLSSWYLHRPPYRVLSVGSGWSRNVLLAENRYDLNAGDAFLDARTRRVRASWKSDRELEVSFEAPLLTGKDTAGKYAAILFANVDAPIEDLNGQQLGTSLSGFTGYEAGNADRYRLAANPGATVIFNAFKEPELTLTPWHVPVMFGYRLQDMVQPIAFGFYNWCATHHTVADFEVAKDTTVPELKAVSAERRDDGTLRIALTFSEPMAAFFGAGVAKADPSLFDLSHYTFAVGRKRGDNAGTKLDGTPVGSLLTSFQMDEEVSFQPSGAVGTSGWLPDFGKAASADPDGVTEAFSMVAFAESSNFGKTAVTVDPDDPRTVWLSCSGAAGTLNGAIEIKARVADVRDPAGNLITRTLGNAHVVTGEVSGAERALQ